MDVLFVGGGPAGLAGAIELANLVRRDNESGGTLGDVQIGVLDKAGALGEHSLSGAIVNPVAMRELFPDLKDSDFPFRAPVSGDESMPDGRILFVFRLRRRCRSGYYIASLWRSFWLAKKAEAAGVNVLTGLPAASLCGRVHCNGSRTTPPVSTRRDPESGTPPERNYCARTVLAEGTAAPCHGVLE